MQALDFASPLLSLTATSSDLRLKKIRELPALAVCIGLSRKRRISSFQLVSKMLRRTRRIE
jgi:hypothetical protein